MKKVRKKVFSIIAVGAIAIGLGTYAHAATYKGYDLIVPVWADSETKSIKKETTGSAYNKVATIGEKGKLVSWVEDSGGKNVTKKVSYTSTGKKTMDYEKASEKKGKNLHLNISTSTGTFHTVETSGEWTPN